MNRKEFKNLIFKWNSLLCESASEDRIKEMVSTLYFDNESKDAWDKIHIEVVIGDRLVEVYFEGMESEYYSANKIVFEFLESYEEYPSLLDGREIWHVQNVSRVNKSWGPLLYEIGIEVISKFKNGVVIPGIEGVSTSAASIWEKYSEREKVESSLNAVYFEERNVEGFYKTNDVILTALEELGMINIRVN